MGQANGAMAFRDSSTSHRPGKYSLKMYVSEPASQGIGMSQEISLNNSAPDKLRIKFWYKTMDCEKVAGVNCRQKNSLGKRLSFTNTSGQQDLLKNSLVWKQGQFLVLVNPDAKKVELIPFLSGRGTVWFDDFEIEPVNQVNVKTAKIVTAYTDTVLKIVKERSFYSDSLNWKVLEPTVREYSNGMTTYNEARALTNYLISELRQQGDNHSSLILPEEVKLFRTSDLEGRGREVITKYLGQGIGYISMPGFASMSDSIRRSFATNTQQKIKDLDTKNNICAWIVDMRDDNGGSGPTMIAGLGPILGEGVYDKNLFRKNELYISTYQNGESHVTKNGKIIDESITKVLHPYTLKTVMPPVAILTGPDCASSGEMTVASFIGRPNTQLFGLPTGGFTRGNDDFILPDSSLLLLSAGVQSDRNGKMYIDRIYPDVVVEQTADKKTDLTLDKAKEWLGSKCR